MQSVLFGKYRLLKRIAIGGTAEVFLAVCVYPDGREEQVVLKKVLPQHARDPRFRQLFHEEALVIASLQHPNIVRLRDFGEMQGTFFLTLEYIDGADLDTLITPHQGKSRTLPPELAAYLTQQVCIALDYVHTMTNSAGTPLKIVHRDISPHNILLSRDGEVKLADFGIAQSIIRADKTTDGSIKGKFAYMSPEQATSGGNIDCRSDIFSLGATFYQMLFGQAPFVGRTELESLDRVRRGEYQLEDNWLSEKHQALIKILRQTLRSRREERYHSAKEMLADLEAYQFSVGFTDQRKSLGEWVRGSLKEMAHAESESLAPAMLSLDAGKMLNRTAVMAQGDASSVSDLVSLSQLGFYEPPTLPDDSGTHEEFPPIPTATNEIKVVALVTDEQEAVGSAGQGAKGSAGQGAKGSAGQGAKGSAGQGAKKYPATKTEHTKQRVAIPWWLQLLLVSLLSGVGTLTIYLIWARTHGGAEQRPALISAPGSTVISAPGATSVSAPGATVISAPGATPALQPIKTEALVDRKIEASPAAISDAGAEESEQIMIVENADESETDSETAPASSTKTGAANANKRVSAGVGKLTINSIPWANVYVDGRYVGTTPLLGLTVSAGVHRVALKDARQTTVRNFVAKVAKNQTRVYSFDLSH